MLDLLEWLLSVLYKKVHSQMCLHVSTIIEYGTLYVEMARKKNGSQYKHMASVYARTHIKLNPISTRQVKESHLTFTCPKMSKKYENRSERYMQECS